MKNSAKKAVILNNFTSPYIYQAILILNEIGIQNESKALRDAEQIVSEYLAKQKNGKEDTLLYSRSKKPQKSHTQFPMLLGMCLFSVSLFLLVLFFCQ